jgi:hypothetical protein
MLMYYFLDTHEFRKGLAASFGYLRERPSSSKMGQFQAPRERWGLARTHLPIADWETKCAEFTNLPRL